MFSLIDKAWSAVQKVFDTAAHFLMRRLGWKKSFMRRCLWHAIVACWSAYAVFLPIRASTSHFPRPVCVAANVGLALLYFAYMTWRYRADDRTDWRRSGAILSPTDAGRAQFVGLWKLLSIGLAYDALWYRPLLARIDAANRPNHLMSALCVSIMAAAFLLEAYLVKTPDRPPPLEEKKAVLVPAYATSRR